MLSLFDAVVDMRDGRQDVVKVIGQHDLTGALVAPLAVARRKNDGPDVLRNVHVRMVS
jgi:hypothetical protein